MTQAITSVQNTNLKAVLEDNPEKISLASGRVYYCLKFDFGSGKKIQFIVAEGYDVEAVAQAVETLARQSIQLDLSQFKQMKDTMSPIYLGVHRNDENKSLELTLFKIDHTGLTLLFPDYKDRGKGKGKGFVEISQHDLNDLKQVAEALRPSST